MGWSYAAAREREEQLGAQLGDFTAALRQFQFSAEEFARGVAAVSRSLGKGPAVEPEAEARAEAFLQGLLTPGERRCLVNLKVVPVIGAETGDLWLVSRRASYNLLRYERFGHLPKPVLYCVSAGQIAPSADLVSSLVLSLRGPEGELLAKANRFNLSLSLNPYSLEPGRAESELYPDLWALAHARCEDEGLLQRTIRRASRMESLA